MTGGSPVPHAASRLAPAVLRVPYMEHVWGESRASSRCGEPCPLAAAPQHPPWRRISKTQEMNSRFPPPRPRSRRCSLPRTGQTERRGCLRRTESAFRTLRMASRADVAPSVPWAYPSVSLCVGGWDQAPVSKLEGAARLSRPDDQVPETEPVHRTQAHRDVGASPRRARPRVRGHGV